MMKHLGLLLVVSALFVGNASATTYYVSTSGSDGNSCISATSTTQINQKRTITAGLACVSAGDALSIHGGTYVENITVPTTANGSATGASGSSWPNATNIVSYTGETVWVKPASGASVVVFPTGGTALSYQIWSGINTDGSNLSGSASPDVYIGHDAHHIRWQNAEDKNAYWSGFNTFEGPYIEIKNNTIHDGDRRCTPDAAHGIYASGFTGNTTGTDGHNLIEGNTIYNFDCQSIDAGIQLHSDPADTNALGGYIVRKNVLHNNGVGIFLADSTTVPIQFYNNIVYGNDGSGVILYHRIAGTLVYNNTIYGNGDRAIEIGTGGTATGILVKNNALVGNSGAPITVWNTDPTSYGTFQFNDYNGNGHSNAIDDQNSLSTNSSNITTAPGFTNATLNDFTISSGGNLVDAGTTLVTVAIDYAGVARPQNGAYDIGAFEFTTGGSDPTITVQPVSQSIISGNTASLSVTALGTGPLTYQWYEGTTGVTSSPISMATSSSYTTPTLMASTNYWVRVTNATSSTADSATAAITVLTPPTISSQPTGSTITTGQTVTLSVTATGSGLTYQWYVGSSGTTTSPISLATTSTYRTPALSMTTSYWVRVTNSGGSVDSSTATVTVSGTIQVVVTSTTFFPLQKQITLTAAQVKALHGTPITLITAPGAGKITTVNRISFASTFGTAAYTGSNNMEFRYTNGSGAKVTADIAFATLNFSSGVQYSTVAGVTTELVPVANAAIVVSVPTANPAAGDSPVTLYLEYNERTAP